MQLGFFKKSWQALQKTMESAAERIPMPEQKDSVQLTSERLPKNYGKKIEYISERNGPEA